MHVLVLGASYGALIAAKVSLAGHLVTVVARPDEIRTIAQKDLQVSLPLWPSAGRYECVLPVKHGLAEAVGQLGALTPNEVDPADFDIAFLAMQEPQVGAAEIVSLFQKIAAARLPLVSLLNMPPLSFLERVPDFPIEAVAPFYHSPAAWQALRNAPQTLASPDAQAFRTDPRDPSRLHVSLATNLKIAPFDDQTAQAKLSRLASDIASTRLADGTALPVKLTESEELLVPFAKMPMLATGNYRCIEPDGIRSIKDAVLSDVQKSASIYNDCCDILRAYDVPERVIVPFEKYAAAAKSLTKPSSVARALAAGARKVERSDAVLLAMAEHAGTQAQQIARIVERTEQIASRKD